jgi:uroporphyrinogen decarboxylase
MGLVAEDIGTQDRLMVSRDHYVRYIKPRHGKYFRQVRDLSPGKLLYHSCGCITSIIEDLIDMGVEALNPIQVTAKGMVPLELKKKYGRHLAFWGSMSTPSAKGRCQSDKSGGTHRTDGEGRLRSLATHNIQPDIPWITSAAFQHARYRPRLGSETLPIADADFRLRLEK